MPERRAESKYESKPGTAHPALEDHVSSVKQMSADEFAEKWGYESQRLLSMVTRAMRTALKASEMSQRELARRIGVSEGRVSQVLAGNENLTLRTLAAVSAGLGCTTGFSFSYATDDMREHVKMAAAKAVQDANVVDSSEAAEQAAELVMSVVANAVDTLPLIVAAVLR